MLGRYCRKIQNVNSIEKSQFQFFTAQRFSLKMFKPQVIQWKTWAFLSCIKNAFHTFFIAYFFGGISMGGNLGRRPCVFFFFVFLSLCVFVHKSLLCLMIKRFMYTEAQKKEIVQLIGRTSDKSFGPKVCHKS